MGEEEFEEKSLVTAVRGAVAQQVEQAPELRVSTPGGRFQVRWDDDGSATALGQLAFFAEFLEVSGLFERWVESCPMSYTSPNAPQVRDVLGTWWLSILEGQRRYAHVTGLRGDAVAPQILGMRRIISDEGLRRALAHLAPTTQRGGEEQRAAREAQLAKSTAWMDSALVESTREALWAPAGFWTLTRRSNCSTGIRTARRSATTRRSRGGPAMSFTPTGLATCGWYWMPKCKTAKRMRPATACRVW